MLSKTDQWDQKEFLKNKKELEYKGVGVYLIDTILEPIERTETMKYNPHEISKLKEGSVLVFYCYSGKTTLKRLEEYRKKFPNFSCVSLKGGKSYWNTSLT